MAKINEIERFLVELDRITELHNMNTVRGVTANNKALFASEIEALSLDFFEERRKQGVDLTTLRSDRTQLKNAVRKRYESATLAYRIEDKYKKKKVIDTVKYTIHTEIALVHPVLEFIDIDRNEKQEYFDMRNTQIARRVGDAHKGIPPSDVINISQPEIFIGHGKKLLSTIAETDKITFYSRIIGILSMTGRRSSEVFLSLIDYPGHGFKLAQGHEAGHKLSFTGQMKVGLSKTGYEANEIHVLCSPREILKSIRECKDMINGNTAKLPKIFMDKNKLLGIELKELARKINSSTSGDMGKIVKTIGFSDCLQKNGTPYHPGLFSVHMLRDISMNLCYYKHVKKKDKQGAYSLYARTQLGHTSGAEFESYAGYAVNGHQYIND